MEFSIPDQARKLILGTLLEQLPTKAALEERDRLGSQLHHGGEVRVMRESLAMDSRSVR